MPGRKNSRVFRKNRPRTKEVREALEARKARKEKNIREQKKAAAGRVSYVKKPLSVRSCFCLGLAAAALLFGYVGIRAGVLTRGKAELQAGALGLCSILCSLVSAGYGIGSFREKDKKYILARLGLVLDVLLLIAWVAVIVIGVRG